MIRDKADPLVRVSRRAMACMFEVCFPADRCEGGARSAIAALELVESLESGLSYFRPDSRIARINRAAADRPVKVEPWLFDLLVEAKKISERTGGAFDVTSAPLWETWGFARRAGTIPTEDQLAEARSSVGSHLLELDAERRTVRFLAPGVKINLGGIGKGYALDACGRRLLASGMNDFLIHAGQSSVLARGRPDRRPAAEQSQGGRGAWEVGVAHPQRPGRRLGILRLADRALGTSTDQFQSFRHRGRRYGHVIDPRTGRPAEGLLSTTLLAPTAAVADALSTALYIMGSAAALEFCRARPELGMVMSRPGSRGANVEIITAGVGEDELRM